MTTEHTEPTGKGSAADALRQPDFRRVFVASSLSNTGRWMQNPALGVLAWKLTESSVYLGAIIFAQLGPLAVLSLVGGSLADSMDRKRLLLVTQAWQMAWTFVLAALVIDDRIGPELLLGLVFVIGLGQGIFAPVFTSIVPSLSGRRNLTAAIALNSVQMNGARVIGPAIGGWLTSVVGFAEVFAINAATYVFVIAAIAVTSFPSPTSTSALFRDRVFGGFRLARRAPQVGRPLVVMTVFSFLCLPFIGQLPAIVEVRLGIDAQSTGYGWFYARFGLGALCGAAAVATLLRRFRRSRTITVTMVGFGVALTFLTAAGSPAPGLVAVFALGLFYFVLPTTLSTLWQERVDDSVRGRIAALWILSFGGTVPFANVLAGPIIEMTSLTTVMLFGAFSAFALAAVVRIPTGPIVGEELLESPEIPGTANTTRGSARGFRTGEIG